VVVTIYERAGGKTAGKRSSEEVARITGLVYNPAVEAKVFTKEDLERVKSRKHPSASALSDTLEKVQARF
jgi:sterol carrier protein 2